MEEKKQIYFNQQGKKRKKRFFSSYYWNEISNYTNYFSHEDSSVLEVGCGSGDLLASISGSIKTGIDFSSEYISWAKEKHKDKKINFLLMDANNIELNQTFDLIIISNLIGFVENSNDFLLQNGIFIAPLLSGSGIKMKVLEAFSLGLPCILTEIAAEGLDLPASIKISKTSDEFTTDLLELIRNESARKQRGADSYCFVTSEFSDKKISSDLKECLISMSSK